MIQFVLKRTERLYEDAQIRQIDITQLEKIVAATHPSRQRFLTELTLDPPDATSDEAGTPLRDEDYLILPTIHSADRLPPEPAQVIVLDIERDDPDEYARKRQQIADIEATGKKVIVFNVVDASA